MSYLWFASLFATERAEVASAGCMLGNSGPSSVTEEVTALNSVLLLEETWPTKELLFVCADGLSLVVLGDLSCYNQYLTMDQMTTHKTKSVNAG